MDSKDALVVFEGPYDKIVQLTLSFRLSFLNLKEKLTW